MWRAQHGMYCSTDQPADILKITSVEILSSRLKHRPCRPFPISRTVFRAEYLESAIPRQILSISIGRSIAIIPTVTSNVHCQPAVSKIGIRWKLEPGPGSRRMIELKHLRWLMETMV